MAILNAQYAYVPEYRAAKDKTTSDDDLVIERQLKAISRYIDMKLSPLFFWKDDEVSTRTYQKYDQIAPFYSTTGLVVKASTGSAINWASVTALTLDTDFELLPINALSGPEPQFFTGINLLSWGMTPVGTWQPKYYVPDDYRYRITALHGSSSVPDAIVEATIELTAILRLESPRATNSINELNQVLSTSRVAQGIIAELLGVYHPTGIVVA